MYYNIYYNKCKGFISRQMGGYIGSKKAAAVYGGLDYWPVRMISKLLPKKNFSLEKWLSKGECS